MNSELNAVLVELASKLNTTVDKLYIVLSKQIYISTIFDIVGLVIWGFVFFFAGKYLYNQKVVKDWAGDISIGTVICRVVFFMGLLIYTICFFNISFELLTLITNPDYLVIEKIGLMFRK